jgi:hypothetical protein
VSAAIGTVLVLGAAAAWAVAAFQPDTRPSIRISDAPLAPPAVHSPTPTGNGAQPSRSGGSAPATVQPTAGTTAGTTAGSTTGTTGTTGGTAGGRTATPKAGQDPAPPSTTASSLPGSPVRDGFLLASGVVDPHSTGTWTQSDIIVRTQVAMRSLQVEVRIAQTAGVVLSGTWTSVDPSDVKTETEVSGSEIVYRFTLHTGVVLQPGQYDFAVQFKHAAGSRDTGRDRWTAAAGAADGSASASLHGDFS